MKAYYKKRMNDLTETTQKLESSLSQEEKLELSRKIKNKSIPEMLKILKEVEATMPKKAE